MPDKIDDNDVLIGRCLITFNRVGFSCINHNFRVAWRGDSGMNDDVSFPITTNVQNDKKDEIWKINIINCSVIKMRMM